jgi:methyl-accepting chemotaxis protein
MASFILVAILTTAICIYMEFQIEHIHEQDEMLYEIGTVPTGYLVEASEKMHEMRVQLREWKISKKDEERSKAVRELDNAKADLIAHIANQNKLTTSEDVKAKMAIWQSAVENYYNLALLFTKTNKKFCPTSGMNIGDWPQDLIDASNEMVKTKAVALEAKIKASGTIAETNEDTAHTATLVSKTVIALIFIISLTIGYTLSRSIVPPLRVVTAELAKLEKGDMTVRTNMVREDAIGKLAKATDSMATNLQKIFTDLRSNSDSIASSSEELSAVSKQLASGAEKTVSQCTSVSSTTEQMATNINSMASGAEMASTSANEVAGAAEEMSGNMNTIAAAIEEMSASISEIANNTTDVRNIATNASTKATEATSVMGKLGSAAKEIGQVTDVIKKIADKTNLLALNATIEAASAGEAGKGFAVVAGEIKELANQSAKSADDIAQRIDSIQRGTSNAVKVITEVSGIIENINDAVKAIANHVDEQTKASSEIASNIAQANTSAKRVARSISDVAKNSNDVSRNATEAARGASEVSSNTQGMTKVAHEGSQGAVQVNQSASELAKIASDLKKVISQFKIS